jgi:uncharacterized membrane protein
MAEVFKVVFSGTLAPTANAEDVARDFAAVFKVSEEQARALVSAGEPRVLKSHVDEANAKRYLEVLEEIGLNARIEPVEVEAQPQPQPQLKPATDAASSVGEQSASVQAARPSDATRPWGDSGAGPAAAEVPRTSVPEQQVREQRVGPVSQPASHGWRWIKHAWQLFKAQPRVWLGAVALVYLVTFVLSLVPVVGSLVTLMLGPVFAGGLMLGAQSQQRTGRLRVTAAFDGFSHQGLALILVGVLYFVGLMLAFMIAGLAAMATGALSVETLEAMSGADPNLSTAALGPGLAVFFLLAMLLLLPLIMAYWFAPALVVLEEMSAFEAMLTSFRACWKNMIPLLVYGLMLFLILVGVSLLFGILAGLLSAISETLMVVAMLLLLPVVLVFASLVVLSIYTAYRDLFYPDVSATGAVAF